MPFYTKNLPVLSLSKKEKEYFFIKNGKKGLTNAEKDAIIVNCIIIARTVGFLMAGNKLDSSNLHKKQRFYIRKAQRNPQGFERYQFFEWSD